LGNLPSRSAAQERCGNDGLTTNERIVVRQMLAAQGLDSGISQPRQRDELISKNMSIRLAQRSSVELVGRIAKPQAAYRLRGRATDFPARMRQERQQR